MSEPVGFYNALTVNRLRTLLNNQLKLSGLNHQSVSNQAGLSLSTVQRFFADPVKANLATKKLVLRAIGLEYSAFEELFSLLIAFERSEASSEEGRRRMELAATAVFNDVFKRYDEVAIQKVSEKLQQLRGSSGVPVIGSVSAGPLLEQFPRSAAGDHDKLPISVIGAPGAFGLKITGNSMAPSFNHGDVVIFSPQRLESIPTGAECYVQLGAAAGNGSTFKKVFPMGNGEVLLVPIARDHQPMTVDAREIVSVHRAIGKYVSLAPP